MGGERTVEHPRLAFPIVVIMAKCVSIRSLTLRLPNDFEYCSLCSQTSKSIGNVFNNITALAFPPFAANVINLNTSGGGPWNWIYHHRVGALFLDVDGNPTYTMPLQSCSRALLY